MQTKSTLAQPKLSFDTNEFFLKSSDEMAERLREMARALAATLEIAERCSVDIELGKMLIPRFPTPDEQSPSTCWPAHAGLVARYGDPPPAEASSGSRWSSA